MSTALITGAAGQDGILLARQLLDLGYRVLGTVTDRARSRALFAAYAPGVEVIELELDDDAEPAVDEAGATDVPTERLPSGDDEASASEDGEEAIFAEVPIVHSPLADEPPHEDFEAEQTEPEPEVSVVADEPEAVEEPEPAPKPSRPTGRKRTPAAAQSRAKSARSARKP